MEARNPQVLSQRLSPQEIRTRKFKRSIGGYSAEEVSEFLDKIAAAWDKVQRQEREMIERNQALTEENVRLKAREGDAAKQKEKILSEVEEIKAEALRQAEKVLVETQERAREIRARTESWLEEILSRVEETERQKKSFVTALRSALGSHLELLDQETERETEPLAARLHEVLRATPGGDSPRSSY